MDSKEQNPRGNPDNSLVRRAEELEKVIYDMHVLFFYGIGDDCRVSPIAYINDQNRLIGLAARGGEILKANGINPNFSRKIKRKDRFILVLMIVSFFVLDILYDTLCYLNIF